MLIHSSRNLKTYIYDDSFKCEVKNFRCKGSLAKDIKSFISSPQGEYKQSIFYITEEDDLVGYMSCRIMTTDTILKSCSNNECSSDCIPFFEVMALARHEGKQYQGFGEALLVIAMDYVSYIKEHYRCDLNNIILVPENDIVKEKFYISKMNFKSLSLDEYDLFDDYMINTDDIPNERQFFIDRDDRLDLKIESLFDAVNENSGKAI